MRKYIVRSVPLLATLVLLAGSASAHEKWFHETQNSGLHWELLFRPMPLAFIAMVVVVTIIAWLYWRRRGRAFVPGPENLGTTDERRSALYGLVPAILGIHIAVPLLVAGVQGGPVAVEVVEVADQVVEAAMGPVLQQVPVEPDILVPLAALGEILAHEQEFLARVTVHEPVQRAQVRELLPRVARHLAEKRSLPGKPSGD